jgi:T6SS, Phospholipase effector Tle1-like, catalytic domain
MIRANRVVPTIEFIGVWDTVAAYGLPADEITRGFSNWIWPLELPNRALSERVLFARHAIALDDERTTFHPVLWTERDVEPQAADTPGSLSEQRLVQVWFVGMHANVGGGYPDDALAFVPLLWMLKEARIRGLDFKSEPDDDPDTFKVVRSAEDKDGRLYNSRSGLGSYYRYGPRKIIDLCNDKDNDVYIALPKIHESVFARIDSGANAYAPIGLPPNYVVATDDGRSADV